MRSTRRVQGGPLAIPEGEILGPHLTWRVRLNHVGNWGSPDLSPFKWAAPSFELHSFGSGAIGGAGEWLPGAEESGGTGRKSGGERQLIREVTDVWDDSLCSQFCAARSGKGGGNSRSNYFLCGTACRGVRATCGSFQVSGASFLCSSSVYRQRRHGKNICLSGRRAPCTWPPSTVVLWLPCLAILLSALEWRQYWPSTTGCHGTCRLSH